MKKVIVLLIFLFCSTAQAEIISVQIRWTPGFCNAGCVQLLSQFLANMQGVGAVLVNPVVGQANLTWKPNFPFSLLLLNNTVARAGVFVEEIRVKVRGKIQARGNAFYLVSDGDNTAFILIGPLQQIPGRILDPFSIQNFPLTPELVANLSQAAQNQLTMEIEGSLNFWQGTQVLYLNIAQMGVVQTQTSNIPSRS